MKPSSLAVLAVAIAVFLTGACITSTRIAAAQPDSGGIHSAGDFFHGLLGVVLLAILLGFGIWITVAPAPRSLRILAWCGFLTTSLASTLAWKSSPMSHGSAALHAILAHISLSIVVLICAGAWVANTETAAASRPFLRPLAIATPLIVLLQVALGALYRHEVLGIMPHMGLAMVVAFAALIASTTVLQHYKRPLSLKRAAAALMTFVLIQVALGIAAFIMLVLNAAGTIYFVATTAAHATFGTATLAASLVLALEVWQKVPASNKAA